ncbi:MAG: M23 family metallopeptidase [Clostridia bacterium]|nr:M23 family metallopeptidase [Clostridia bacterium]
MDEKNNNLSPNHDTKPPKKSLKDILFIKSLRPKMPKMNGIKIAYALAILLAIGGALSARLTANKAINDINVTFPQESYTLPTPTLTYTEAEEPDFEVRQNLTDVPDERYETETEAPTTTIPQTTIKPTEYAEPFTNSFTLPLGTDISKDYNPNTPVYNKTMGDWRTHPAVDFSGDSGAQVKSIATGKVVKIYDDALYGTVVEIDHGNELIARYCGINKETLEIKENNSVKAGALIGYLGEIPCEKDEISHLHFEIIYQGKNTDPMAIMGR